MLRNNYLNKYKNKIDFATNLYKDDDDLLLQSHRPLTDKSITNLNNKNFETFLDEILINKKMSDLLYQTNADKEIKYYKKEIDSNRIKKYTKNNKKLEDNLARKLILDKSKKETILAITKETKSFKEKREQRKNIIEEKCGNLFNKIKIQNHEDKLKQFKNLNNERLERIEKIFYGIKNKLEKNYNETKKNTVNKKIILPDIQLKMNDVYSRLYYNQVLLTKSDRTSTNYLNTEFEDDENNPITSRTKTEANLNVKNIINQTNGKEFTVKITDEILTKCFSKHSGGPQIEIGEIAFNPTSNNKREDEEYHINLLEIKNNLGDSLIHISVKENYIELVEYLLLKGVNVNTQNIQGDTPLHLAIRNDHIKMIEILLESKAKIDLSNKKGETSYDIATIEVRKHFGFEDLIKEAEISNKKYKY